METDFSDKVAIVTGASRGIGKGLALELASRGTAVVVAAKTMEESDARLPGSVQETVREIEARGGRALGLQCDVRNDADLKNVVDRTLEEFGRVDILVNNAGAIWIQPVEGTPQKRFDLMTSINFRAPFLLAHYCIPDMRRRNWGHIVNMSPPLDGASGHIAGKVAYMASKLNATLLALGLARELEGDGIACNAIWPRTLIGTAATQNIGIGSPEDWRTEDIVVDATMAVLEQDPAEVSGNALIDDEILARFKGIEDLSRYRVVPDREPTPMTWERWDRITEQAREMYFAAKTAAGSSAAKPPQGA